MLSQILTCIILFILTDELRCFPTRNGKGDEIPWFPKEIHELDKAQNILMYGEELDADHPGFKDPVYRDRRLEIAKIARNYRHGQPIPIVPYEKEELETWKTVFLELHELYLKCACKEQLKNWPELVEHCGYRPDNIPQIEDVNGYLKRKTGFQLRPVAGYVDPRDFLSGLAFRVFPSTQYIRHPSQPFFTPEPDCCHELLGHVPMLTDPSFAEFSQEIGLASLGASDEDVKKIAALYFYTVEFGLCKQNGEMRAYGAGLLSSVEELKHVMEELKRVVKGREKFRKFDPEIVSKQECDITHFQKTYYYAESLEEVKEKLREFVYSIEKPFGIRYNAYTRSVQLLDNAENIAAFASELRGNLHVVRNSLRKIEADEKVVEEIKETLNVAM